MQGRKQFLQNGGSADLENWGLVGGLQAWYPGGNRKWSACFVIFGWQSIKIISGT